MTTLKKFSHENLFFHLDCYGKMVHFCVEKLLSAQSSCQKWKQIQNNNKSK